MEVVAPKQSILTIDPILGSLFARRISLQTMDQILQIENGHGNDYMGINVNGFGFFKRIELIVNTKKKKKSIVSWKK